MRLWAILGALWLAAVLCAAQPSSVPPPASATPAQRSAVAAQAAKPAPSQPDAMEIVRRSLSFDQRNFEAGRDYVYQRHVLEKRLDGGGKIKSSEERMYEQFVLYDEPYERLMSKNGQPLSDKDREKEEERWEKLKESREHESDADRRERLVKREKRRRENREFLQEIPDAFMFSLLGSDTVNGREVWIIGAEPRPGYKPKRSRAQILAHMRCKFWVDKSEYQWVKAEAELIDNFNFAAILARLNKGTRLEFEQQKVNDEVWLPRRQYISGMGRLLVMSGGVEQETTFSNYRKFHAEAKIVSTQ